MSKNLSDNFNGVTEAVKEYIQARIELMKLTALGKATQITTQIVSSLILILFSMIILVFAFVAFVVWYGQAYNDYLTGLLIAVGALVVLAILFYLLKKPLLTSIVLRGYLSLFFEENEKEER
jgi:hypothetical protein